MTTFIVFRHYPSCCGKLLNQWRRQIVTRPCINWETLTSPPGAGMWKSTPGQVAVFVGITISGNILTLTDCEGEPVWVVRQQQVQQIQNTSKNISATIMKNKIHNKLCAILLLNKITRQKHVQEKFWDLPRPAECMNACVYNKATSPKQVVRVVAKPAKQYKVVVQRDCHHRPDIERNITLQYAKHKQQVTLCDYERSHSRWWIYLA